MVVLGKFKGYQAIKKMAAIRAYYLQCLGAEKEYPYKVVLEGKQAMVA